MIGKNDKGIGSRRANVKKLIDSGELETAPLAHLSKDKNGNLKLSFTDGRHRFAELRDNGATKINLSFDKESLKLIDELKSENSEHLDTKISMLEQFKDAKHKMIDLQTQKTTDEFVHDEKYRGELQKEIDRLKNKREELKKDKQATAPTDEQILEDVKNKNFSTFTYENESDIPEVFKDKISSKGETNGKKFFNVTLPKSEADYLLAKEQNKTQPKVEGKVFYQGIPKTTAYMQALLDENGNPLIQGSLSDVEKFKKDNGIDDEKVKYVDLDTSNPDSLINKFLKGNKVETKTTPQVKTENKTTPRPTEGIQQGDVVKYAGKDYEVTKVNDDGKTISVKDKAGNEYHKVAIEDLDETPNAKKEIEQQLEDFGVGKKDIPATKGLLQQVFDGLKKAGLTTAKTVGEWVGIGKGKDTANSLKQIIGQKGASRLENAEKIIGDLNIAKQMEALGKSPKEIWAATGWEKGVDGKWKYEIPDVKINTDSLTKIGNGLFSYKGENISKAPDLSEVISGADELFKAYPELKGVKIILAIDPNANSKASYSEENNAIRIISKSNEAANLTLLHEIQHAIQRIEGFARGGNMDSAEKISESDWDKLINDIKSNDLVNPNGSAVSEEKRNELLQDLNEIRKDYANLKKLNEKDNDSTIKMNMISLGLLQLKIAKARAKLKKYKYHDAIADLVYDKLAGEVEARNVSNRREFMNDTQRKQFSLSETADVTREQQIILQGAIKGEVNSKNNQPLFHTDNEPNETEIRRKEGQALATNEDWAVNEWFKDLVNSEHPLMMRMTETAKTSLLVKVAEQYDLYLNPDKPIRNAAMSAVRKEIGRQQRNFRFEKETKLYDKFGENQVNEFLFDMGTTIDKLNKQEVDFINSFETLSGARRALLSGDTLNQGNNAQYRIESGKNIIEAIKDFKGGKKSVVALTHEIMHPTVVAIIDGAEAGNEVGLKHANTIVDEYNKANPQNKVTLDELIKGNNDFKNGKTSDSYRAVQEFIADSWERYHHEGQKAGFSEAFKKVLDTITNAFKSVYKSFKDIPEAKVTPELRKMFDDILGKEEMQKGDKKTTSIFVAPFYDTQVNSLEEADSLSHSPAVKEHIKNIHRIADITGVKILSIESNIGGYTHTDTGKKVNELSHKIELDTDDLDKATKFSAMLGALTPEVQETTIAGKSLNEAEWGGIKHNATEIRIKVDDLDKTFQIAKLLDIDYSLNTHNSSISFLDFGKGGDLDFTEKMRIFAEELKNKNITYDTEAIPIESRLIGAKTANEGEYHTFDRKGIFKVLRSENSVGGREMFLDAISQAEARNNEFIRQKELAPERKLHAELRDKQIELNANGKELSDKELKQLTELEDKLLPSTSKTFTNAKSSYDEAKNEIDKVGEQIVGDNGFVAKSNIKNPDRAAVKTLRWYQGKAHWLGDGARTTIIVYDKADVEPTFRKIQQEFNGGIIRDEHNVTELGYPKKLLEVRTSNGRIAEFQVMTPEGYLGKDGVKGFPEEQQKFAQEQIDKIREKLGWDIPDGAGHYLYEINRDVHVPKELKDEAARLSNQYYEAIMNPSESKLDGEQFKKDLSKFVEKVDSADKSKWDKGNKAIAPDTIKEFISEQPIAKEKPIKDIFYKKADNFRENNKDKEIILKGADGREIKITKTNSIVPKDLIVEGIAKAIEKTGDVLQAIHDYLHEQDWYKSLSKDDQQAVSKQLEKEFSDKWTSVRKEKLKEIEGSKKIFEARTKVKWTETYDNALKHLAEDNQGKSLYEAMKLKVDSFANDLAKGKLFNPTSEDIAIFNVFDNKKLWTNSFSLPISLNCC